jgi:Ni/Co efflux regulator RcnB
MNKKAVLAAVLAISLSWGNFAFAKDKDRDNDRGHGRHEQERGGRGHDGHGDRGHKSKGHGHSHRGQGAGPNHEFHRGDRLSHHYRHRNYVVGDWRGHHLSAPPRGHQWVQTGGDYVLVSVGTGIIVQVMLGR